MPRSNTRASSVAGYWALVTSYKAEQGLSSAEARRSPEFQAAYRDLQRAKRDLAIAQGIQGKGKRGGGPKASPAERKARAKSGQRKMVKALETLGYIDREMQKGKFSPKVKRSKAPGSPGIVAVIRGVEQRF